MPLFKIQQIVYENALCNLCFTVFLFENFICISFRTHQRYSVAISWGRKCTEASSSVTEVLDVFRITTGTLLLCCKIYGFDFGIVHFNFCGSKILSRKRSAVIVITVFAVLTPNVIMGISGQLLAPCPAILQKAHVPLTFVLGALRAYGIKWPLFFSSEKFRMWAARISTLNYIFESGNLDVPKNRSPVLDKQLVYIWLSLSSKSSERVFVRSSNFFDRNAELSVAWHSAVLKKSATTETLRKAIGCYSYLISSVSPRLRNNLSCRCKKRTRLREVGLLCSHESRLVSHLAFETYA